MKHGWRRLTVVAISCALGAATASWGAEPSGDASSSGLETDTIATARVAQDSKLENELQWLRQTLMEQTKKLEAQQATIAEQQQRLELIAAKLEARTLSDAAAVAGGAPLAVNLTRTEQVAANTASAVQTPGPQSAADLQKDLADVKKSLEDRIRAIGPFQFSGDFRMRYEPFFGGGTENAPTPDRHRERFRLRVNGNARLNDEFSGGFALASGDPSDPISSNQTLTGFFTRKPFLIDRAFVQYRPVGFKALRITGGKFAYPWIKTELTWDNDINPEGASEALSWDWSNGTLQHLGLVAFQLAMNEVAGGRDSAVIGEQLQTSWKLHDRAKLGANIAFYDYRRPDAIAANQSPGGGATGSSGSLTGGNFTNFSGLLGGTRTYASRFGVLDAIARLDINTGAARFPLMLQFNFAQNTRACQNLHRFTDAGAAAPACDPTDRHAYWAEVQFGRNLERGDVRFGYAFMRIERDAVVSAFNLSDIRQPTNVVNHRLEFAYQLNSNVQLAFTNSVGRQLVTASSPLVERWLKRLQLDMIYRF